MEIRPTSDQPIGLALQGAIAALEAKVDKTELAEFTIETDEQYVAEFEALKRDKVEIKMVEDTLSDFASLAFRIHRKITGAINKYSGYGQARARVRDAALVRFDDEKERKRLEDEERLRQVALHEDEERRKLEAESIREADPERAEEILNEPVREIAVSVPKQIPTVKGGGFRERYIGRCVDEDELVKGVARPEIYAEVIAFLKPMIDQKKISKRDMVNALVVKASECPVIPASIFVSTKGAKDALDTKITANANATNGKIKWPGVVVETEKKTSTRTR